jgi:hypothetical protein
VSSVELRNQIAKCHRLARLTDAETARRLLQLASEYEAQMARQTAVSRGTEAELLRCDRQEF